eukprot:14097752-Ditylum_brightwellii.AAC.1
MCTENVKSNTSKTQESNRSEAKGGGKKDDKKGSGKNKPWNNNFSAWVSIEEFWKLPKEEKEKQIKARSETKRAEDDHVLQTNSLQLTPMHTVMTITPSTIFVPFQTVPPTMTPVQPGIGNKKKNQNDGTP